MAMQAALGQSANPPGTAEVVAAYKQMVYAICLTHTPCRGDADDVFQEVFLTYHRKQPVCHDDEHRKAWLIRTTLNIVRRFASQRAPQAVPLEGDVEDRTTRVEAGEYDGLFAALNSLSDTYKTVLHLFYLEDLPIAQIAALLDLEAGTVKTRLSRGRVLLRQAMNEEDSDGTR